MGEILNREKSWQSKEILKISKYTIIIDRENLQGIVTSCLYRKYPLL